MSDPALPKLPPNSFPEPLAICGTARLHGERVSAGGGDPMLGDLVLAQRALAEAEGAVTRGPLHMATLLLRVCRALSALGRYDEGRPLLERALALLDEAPQDDEAARALGDAFYLLRDKEPALAATTGERAIALAEREGTKIDASHTRLWRHAYASALHAAGAFAQAETVFRRAIALDVAVVRPEGSGYVGTIMLRLELARACLAQHKATEALAELDNALAECPGGTLLAEAHGLRGECFRALGAPGSALAAERTAIALYRATVTRLEGNGPSSAPTVARFRGLIAELEART